LQWCSLLAIAPISPQERPIELENFGPPLFPLKVCIGVLSIKKKNKKHYKIPYATAFEGRRGVWKNAAL
jgi:hypothetical protein